MTELSRRRFIEAAAMMSIAAPLAACGDDAAISQTPVKVETGQWQDAVSQLAARERGDVTALQLVETAIRRLEAVNERINAVALPNFERARAMARAGTTGPLAGLPTLVKDNQRQAGLPYTQGSRALAGYIADETDPYAAAMEGAGLISIGRSTLPEYGLTATTEPLLTGPTRNPWNPDHSSGGSSGGSAAAVAAGVVPVAHANDGGGSIRIPAAACGLVGLKPSRGRMAGDDASDDATDLGVQGCVSRTVRDTAIWFNATQGGPGFEPATLVTGPIARRLRVVGHLQRPDGSLPDADVQRVHGDAIALLETLGHNIGRNDTEIFGPELAEDFLHLWSRGAHLRLEATKQLAGLPDDFDLSQGFEPLMLDMAARGGALTEEQMTQIVGRLEAFKARYRAGFANMDVLVTPVLGSAALAIGELSPTIPFADQADLLTAYAGFTGAENVAGLPAISLPVGESASGLPIGLQFVAAPGNEAMLLGLAFELEEALKWYERKPGIWVGDMV
ncbi:hypothetical protein KCG44_06525 [Pacificimonas sp. WHA3]|uniref:Amidase domain-containing protein n=1 Tax=Pacificimonas pallii TaxID=2827236 RepID=A0ABS6SDF2_9SPHN|nr:amidase family protein [Pacificimonas pallii]MBV7256439.1 hypothetical protein [Pacificimonas pallii]